MTEIMPPAERRFYLDLFSEICNVVADFEEREHSLVEGLAKAGVYMAGRDIENDRGFPKESVLPAE